MTMAALAYDTLAIDADAGFPQLFRQTVAGAVYRFALYVSIAEDVLEAVPDDALLELPSPGAFMVLVVDREADGARLLRTKLIPNREYGAYELQLTVGEMLVAKANLNAAGAVGSIVEGGVAARWPS
jgi:hypothetical protein